MFKKSYNVQKASGESSKTTTTMTLKKKEKIKSMNNLEAPDYRNKAPPKKVTTTKWVENKTFTPAKKKIEKKIEKKKEIEKKAPTETEVKNKK